VRGRVARALVRASLQFDDRADLVRLGSSYGGWWVPEDPARLGGIAYCAGIGSDITFDLSLIERFGFEVWAFDPTPSVIESVPNWDTPRAWHFEPVGLWDSPGHIRFCSPANPAHGSVSATNIQRTETYIEAPVDTLERIMRRLGHQHIDLLKMDIEGAEGPVLESMIATGVYPRVLCVEFDQPESASRVTSRIRAIFDAGYRLHKGRGLELHVLPGIRSPEPVLVRRASPDLRERAECLERRCMSGVRLEVASEPPEQAVSNASSGRGSSRNGGSRRSIAEIDRDE
jgi:FkbM family methyltransferase